MISNNEFKAISVLDLDPIKVKLMHKESGEGWTLEYANVVESEYRRFLYLMKMFPNEQTAPLFDVDVFWHYHILDTMKYAVDCETVFGYFLHHFPYVGLRGEDDEAAHQRFGVRMQELYEETFGESYRLTEQDGPETAYSAAVTDAPVEAIGKTAYSAAVTGIRVGAIGKTAYSAAVTGAAAGAVGKTAYSARVTGAPAGAVGKTAYSARVTGAPAGAVGKTAYSARVTGAPAGAVGKTAYSARVTGAPAEATGKTAYSARVTGAPAGATGKTAYSARVTGARVGARGKPAANMQDGSWVQTATVDRFYVERPLLAA